MSVEVERNGREAANRAVEISSTLIVISIVTLREIYNVAGTMDYLNVVLRGFISSIYMVISINFSSRDDVP